MSYMVCVFFIYIYRTSDFVSINEDTLHLIFYRIISNSMYLYMLLGKYDKAVSSVMPVRQ